MNENELKQMTFIAACREFFGKLPHQTLQDFAAEIKQLTPDDKQELIKLFRSVGIDATKVS